jgi:hypothetical protein
VSNIQVLQVTSGEFLVSYDLDLAITFLADDNCLAQVSGTAVDLDAIVEELLEGGEIEDLVVDGGRAVDNELCGQLS